MSLTAELLAALRPFAEVAAPRHPAEGGAPSVLEIMEGANGTGELYLASHYGTSHQHTLYADDFRRAYELLHSLGEA